MIHGACVAFGMACAPAVRAHEGPPFPVLVDEPAPPWSITVWADPDVGTGTFWVQLASHEGAAIPDDTVVSIHAAPADGREPETRWVGEAGPFDGGQQHVVMVEFPTQEPWTIRMQIASDAAGASAERRVTVDVTPPGYGPIDLLLYTWPFLALGGLWIKALMRRRQTALSDHPAANSP